MSSTSPSAHEYALIGCSKKKLPMRMPAWSMYLGSSFATFMAYARVRNLNRFVLSGKHGLLTPYSIIEPYDFDLEAMTHVEQIAWSNDVAEQIRNAIPPGSILTFMAGPAYTNNVMNELEDEFTCGSLSIEDARKFVGDHYTTNYRDPS
mgnify:CR=1 FL=1